MFAPTPQEQQDDFFLLTHITMVPAGTAADVDINTNTNDASNCAPKWPDRKGATSTSGSRDWDTRSSRIAFVSPISLLR